MKKFISLMLVLLLCVGLAAPAFASEYEAFSFTWTAWDGTPVNISGYGKITENYTLESVYGEFANEYGTLIELQPGSQLDVSDSSDALWIVGFPYGVDNGKYYDIMTAQEDAIGLHSGDVDYQFNDYIVLYSQTDDAGNKYFITLDGAAGTDEPVAPAAPQFNDVAENDYFFEPVKWAVANGITDGTTDTTFSPKTTCSTAHILTFLWRAMGSPEAAVANPFSDIAGGEYYYNAALWAYENGLVSGSAFNGGSDCTRSMTVTYLWKLAGQPAADAAAFNDVAADAEYAQAVAWAVAEGITDGTSATTFSPDQTCTRGQIVTFLWRDLA